MKSFHQWCWYFNLKRVIYQCKRCSYLLNSSLILVCNLFQTYNFILCKQKEREADHEITHVCPCIQSACFGAGCGGRHRQAWCSRVLAGLWPSQMPLTFTALFLLLGWPVRSGVRSKCGWGLDAFHRDSSGHSLLLVPANTNRFSRWLFMICQERPQPEKASSQHIRGETASQWHHVILYDRDTVTRLISPVLTPVSLVFALLSHCRLPEHHTKNPQIQWLQSHLKGTLQQCTSGDKNVTFIDAYCLYQRESKAPKENLRL